MVIRVRPRQPDSRRARRATRIVDSLAAVAEFAGVAVPSAAAWFERGAPRTADGRYDLWEIARWHAENVGRRSAEAGEAGGQAIEEAGSADGATGSAAAGAEDTRAGWELRRLRAIAQTAELQLQRARGEVIPRTDHDAIVFAVVDSFVSGLEQMPARVVPLLVGARGYQEMDQIVRDQIRSLRIQLAAKHSPPEEPGSRG